MREFADATATRGTIESASGVYWIGALVPVLYSLDIFLKIADGTACETGLILDRGDVAVLVTFLAAVSGMALRESRYRAAHVQHAALLRFAPMLDLTGQQLNNAMGIHGRHAGLDDRTRHLMPWQPCGEGAWLKLLSGQCTQADVMQPDVCLHRTRGHARAGQSLKMAGPGNEFLLEILEKDSCPRQK